MRKNILNWMKLSSFIFALSSLFASCSNELDETLQPAGNGTLQFVVSDFPTFGEGTATRDAIGEPDEGKTAWADNDALFVSLYSQEYGLQTMQIIYEDGAWKPYGELSYLKDETPTITALYAPSYCLDGTVKLKNNMKPGMGEYIETTDCTIEDGEIKISFENVERSYSRLRIATLPRVSLIVATTGFTPAEADNTSSESGDVQQTEEAVTCTLTADEKGNAYLYGTFAANATVTVNDDLAKYDFTEATVAGVSYALGCSSSWPYLTFTANAVQIMNITAVNDGEYYWHESMEYSVDEREWASLTVGTDITFGGETGTLRLRGKSFNGTSDGGLNHSKVSFTNSDVKVVCSGDIRTLVDYENYATVSTANAQFWYLFSGCTSLTTAPELPATTLADYCYRSMFEGCTSLITAPALPATTLANSCYLDMFKGCTSLTTAPALPATELADYCCQSMFSGCTSLTTAPTLPATTLADCCYYEMFKDCTSLNNITMLATDITSASDCLFNWVSGVAQTGTFYKNSEATWDETDTSVIPEGWTVENYTAPEE